MTDSTEEDEVSVQEVDPEVVELLVSSFPKATNAECRRFLAARNGSLEGATNQLKDYMEWFELHEIGEDDVPEEEDDAALWTRVARKATLYETDEAVDLPRAVRTHEDKSNKETPGGCAKDGTLVIQVLPALIDLDIAPATTYALAMALYVVEKLDRNSLDKGTVMLDVRAGTGFPNASAYTLYPFIKAVASMLNNHAPERLKRCLLYPLPTLSLYLWEGIKPFLDEETTTKIQLLSGSAAEDAPPPEEAIMEFLDKELLDELEEARKKEFREPKEKAGWW